MKRSLVASLLTLLSFGLLGQNALRQVCQLPSNLSEISGIIEISKNQFILLNDGGNPSELYVIDSNCSITRTVSIKNAPNTDWEDLAKDNKGNLYVGDFGNNANNRRDLVVWKIDSADFYNSDTITALPIPFVYDNQSSFPPNDASRNFDMEAMIWFADSLYLFSKNRTSPFNGFTYMYSLADHGSDSIAHLRDSFFTGIGLKEFYWISGAAYQASDSQLLLLGSDKFWKIKFPGVNTLIGPLIEQLSLGSFTQKEGIAIGSESDIYITDEVHNILVGGNLYHWTSTSSILVERKEPEYVINHLDWGFEIKLQSPARLINLHNQLGQLLEKEPLNNNNIWAIETQERGIYYAHILYENRHIWLKLLH